MLDRRLALVLVAALVASCGGTAQPTASAAKPTPSTAPTTLAAASPSTVPSTPSPIPAATAAASASPTAAPAPTPVPRGTVTRLVIATLKIDLPVVAIASGKPLLCGVAYSMPAPFGQPGDAKAVYLAGMPVAGSLLPLRTAVLAGRDLAGTEVQVYTSADAVFTYSVAAVRRHATNYVSALAATTPQLWIQTGDDRPRAYIQLVADQAGRGVAADHADAHPAAKPAACR